MNTLKKYLPDTENHENDVGENEKKPLTPTQAQAARVASATAFLGEYSMCQKLLGMNEYEREYFKAKMRRGAEDGRIVIGTPPDTTEDGEWQARMFEIRRFVLSLGNCNEKLFLFYHYLHGEPVEKCAELLGISRRSGFRLKKRALEYAAIKLEKYVPSKNCRS